MPIEKKQKLYKKICILTVFHSFWNDSENIDKIYEIQLFSKLGGLDEKAYQAVDYPPLY